MAARNSKMAAKINIKSKNGVLVSEKKLNNAENNISGLFANNHCIERSWVWSPLGASCCVLEHDTFTHHRTESYQVQLVQCRNDCKKR